VGIPPTIAVECVAIVLLSAFVQGTTGFGFGLTSMALLPLIILPQQANVLMTILATVNSLIIAIYMRKHADWKLVGLFLSGAVFGLPIGVHLLRSLDEEMLKRVVGVTVTGAALCVMFFDRLHSRPLSDFLAPVAGSAGGVLSGVASIGGPPVILYSLLRRSDKETMKATLVTYFTMSGCVKTCMLIWVGMMTPKFGLGGLLLSPVVYVGTHLGMRLFSRIPQKLFRRIVCGLLMVIGLSMALR